MPSNDSLGRTLSHIVFKRARSRYALFIHDGLSPREAYLWMADWVNNQNLTPGTREQILAAVLTFPKPSTEKIVMIQRRRLFAEAAEIGGLATEANALRRFEKVKSVIDELHMDYFVLVHDGRFFPVVRLREGQTHLMHFFIDRKIGVM